MKRSHQQGYLLIAVVATLFAIGVTVFLSRAAYILTSSGGQFARTKASLQKINDSLIGYVSVNKALPCPANGSLPSSSAQYGATEAGNPTTCAFADGVVPWKALGLTIDDVTDQWGRLVSYRVFDGATGLTQVKGTTAEDCDTDNIDSVETPPTNGLCSNDHNSALTAFLAGKGRTVKEYGNTIPDAAFVLISHGRTGLGGYTPEGSRLPMPLSPAEIENTLATPATGFWAKEFSGPEVNATDATHFDDLVSYIRLSDLLVKARVEARNWPENPAKFTPATTSNMDTPSGTTNPHFMSTGGAAAGQGFAPTADPEIDGGGGVTFGYANGAYSGCLWWPVKYSLVTGTFRRALVTYMEFAIAEDAVDRFGGFTLAYLSGDSSMPDNTICGTDVAVSTAAVGSVGDTVLNVVDATSIAVGMNVSGTGIDPSAQVATIVGTTVTVTVANTAAVNGTVRFADSKRIRRDMGWGGGTLATNYPRRFAVEFDAFQDIGDPGPPVVPTAQDPLKPHLSVDYTGVVHGTSEAAPCTDVGSGLQCDSRVSDFPSVSTTATGTLGTVVMTVSSTSGIVNGMEVSGTGIASGTTVTFISGSVVGLSKVLGSDLTATNVSFSTLSSAQLLQNGLDTFHSIRSEIYSQDCVTKAGGAGFLGLSSITVPDSSQVHRGMAVFGKGIAYGATVTGVSGTTVSLSSSNDAMVSGPIVFGRRSTVSTSATGDAGSANIVLANPSGVAVGMSVAGVGIGIGAIVTSFSGATVNLSIVNSGAVSGTVTFGSVAGSYGALMKTWTFSNAGCNANTTTCNQLKTVGALFNENVSGNSQFLHAASCVPAPTPVTAFDKLYFGVTTASRATTTVTGPVLSLRRLATAESNVLP